MVVLDTTIVNIALPHIQGALEFSTTQLSWVVNAYTPALPPPRGHQVLAEGIATVFWAGVGLVGLAVVTALFVVRVLRSDLEALSGAAGPGGHAA